MPNTPAQFPNFDLPGAEWFGLSPNAQIAIQGRRRNSASQLFNLTAGQSGWFSLTLTMENGFLPTSAIYLHDAFIYAVPFDASGTIAIGGGGMWLTLNTSDPSRTGYPLGQVFYPGLWLGGNSVLSREQERLITQRDINTMIEAAPTNVLSLNMQVGLNNGDTGNPRSMTLVLGAVWTRLDGLTE